MFYKEEFERLPAEIQRMLAHKKFVPASLGYEPFKELRKYDHIAIGVDSPVFPDVGFHAESNFRYEETDGINKEEEPEKEKEPSISDIVRIEMEKQMEIWKKTVFPEGIPETLLEAPAEEAVEEQQDTVEPPKEEPTAPQPKPLVEPERTFSKDTGTEASDDGLFVKESGARVIKSAVAGLDKEKK